jgi:hypothetical protein
MEKIILDYLKKQCNEDIGLKNRFDEKYIKGCISYINKQARKQIKGSSGYIADEVVYKWARDYFVDEIFKNKPEVKTEPEKTPVEEKELESETVIEKTADKKASVKKTEKKVSVLSDENTDDLYQLELFDFGDE